MSVVKINYAWVKFITIAFMANASFTINILGKTQKYESGYFPFQTWWRQGKNASLPHLSLCFISVWMHLV